MEAVKPSMARWAKPARVEIGVVWNGRRFGDDWQDRQNQGWHGATIFTGVAAGTGPWSDREALGEIPAPTVFWPCHRPSWPACPAACFQPPPPGRGGLEQRGVSHGKIG